MVDLSSPYFWIALGIFLVTYYAVIVFSFFRDSIKIPTTKKAGRKGEETLNMKGDLRETPRLRLAFAAYKAYVLSQKGNKKSIKDFPVLLHEPYYSIIKEIDSNQHSTNL